MAFKLNYAFDNMLVKFFNLFERCNEKKEQQMLIAHNLIEIHYKSNSSFGIMPIRLQLRKLSCALDLSFVCQIEKTLIVFMFLLFLLCFHFNLQAAVIGTLCFVQSTPVKVSRPQAITAVNLTQEQADSLIQAHPSRPSILQPSDQFLPPSIPLYLPDPERNKTKDDFYLLAAYPQDERADSDNPVKVPLSLDSYVRPPPLPSLDAPINFQAEQAQKDKSSYSYNNRYDYYFPVKVVYDDNQQYAEKELQLMEMQPPIQNDEPNYYDVKPKKVPKKYQPNKKDVNHSKSYGRDDRLVPIDNDGLVLDSEHSSFVTSQPVERFAPAPSYRDLTDDDLNTGEYIPKYRFEQNTEAISLAENHASSTSAAAESEKLNVHKLHESGESHENEHENEHENANENENHNQNENENVDDIEQGKESRSIQGDVYQGGDSDTSEKIHTSKRIEFQMHGFEGPNSYKFGYDTGRG